MNRQKFNDRLNAVHRKVLQVGEKMDSVNRNIEQRLKVEVEDRLENISRDIDIIRQTQ